MSPKKLLIILTIILALIIAGLLAYNSLLVKELPPEEEGDTKGQPGLPSADDSDHQEDGALITGGIKAISQEAVIGPAVDKDKIKYYLAQNGNVFQSNFDGSELTRLSSDLLPNLIDVLWSHNKEMAITSFEDNGLVKKYYYNHQNEISKALDKNIRSLSWAPKQNKIAYQYYDPKTQKNNISIADTDGSNWENIFETRMKNLIVEWPGPDKLSLRTRPSGLAQSVLYTLDINSGNFQKIIKETYGMSSLWSPDGDKILFTETDYQGKNIKLKMTDTISQTTKEFNFATLPEKCVFSQDNRTLFCAVPQEIPQQSTMPDDYYKGAIPADDEFWQINLETEEMTQIYQSALEKKSYDAQNLILSPKEDYLLFINQKDGQLYSLGL